MQRVQKKLRGRRLDLGTQWQARVENGKAMDPHWIFFTDEKYFQLGQAPGGAQHFRARAPDNLKKLDAPEHVIRTGDGCWQCGPSVPVAMGVLVRQGVHPHFREEDDDQYRGVLGRPGHSLRRGPCVHFRGAPLRIHAGRGAQPLLSGRTGILPGELLQRRKYLLE